MVCGAAKAPSEGQLGICHLLRPSRLRYVRLTRRGCRVMRFPYAERRVAWGSMSAVAVVRAVPSALRFPTEARRPAPCATQLATPVLSERDLPAERRFRRGEHGWGTCARRRGEASCWLARDMECRPGRVFVARLPPPARARRQNLSGGCFRHSASRNAGSFICGGSRDYAAATRDRQLNNGT